MIDYRGRFEFPVTPSELWSSIEHSEKFEAWWPWLQEFTLEGGELGIQLRGALGQLRRGHAVLARQFLDGRQAPLDLLLARGIKVEALAVVLELARRLAHLDAGFLQQRQYAQQLRVERGETAQRTQRTADPGVGAAGFVSERPGRRGRNRAD